MVICGAGQRRAQVGAHDQHCSLAFGEASSSHFAGETSNGPGQGLTRGLEAEQRDGARLSFGQYEVKAGNSNQKYRFSTVPMA
jgi:hypothetical protein